MSGHSVTVKRADEVVAGDWINHGGVAAEVYWTSLRTYKSGETEVGMGVGNDTVGFNPDSLVEVMDK